jgi:hypothetical protein
VMRQSNISGPKDGIQGSSSRDKLVDMPDASNVQNAQGAMKASPLVVV